MVDLQERTLDLPESTERLRRRHLFGLDFVDATSLEPVIDALMSGQTQPTGADRVPVVVTPNVDQLVHLDRHVDPVSSELMHSAVMVLPDGQPVVWASRLLGRPLRSRLTGSTLVHEMWPRVVAEGARSVVIASSESVASRVDAEGSHCHAVVAPMIDLDDRAGLDAFVDTCATLIDDTDAEFVFVTLGYPKQCHIIAGLRDRLPDSSTIFLAIGASFDMHYGLVRRAPQWVQRIGMEWAFRLLQEPRRLFRRYLIDDPSFVRIVDRENRRLRSLRLTAS
ncbi:MAG TPA: WecB/TagA/CpsF family glycosyltransferase [Ilumatobacteraceae bacterium]|nr:WecB/TagA/CpsF family glycosyltransferase [Ilumatobacteraceae bacterium]